jgi:AcrR family transcriptional regulator
MNGRFISVAQILKDEVRQQIATAALEVFARDGFVRATMAQIAREAGISTGNVYRYHATKEALFDELVGDELPAALTRMLKRRIAALAGVSDVRKLAPNADYHLLAGELLRYCVDNRLRVVIVLGRAAGTRHAGFAQETASLLERLALAHFRALHPRLRLSEPLRFDLAGIYRSYLAALVDILAHFSDEAQIREAVDGYSRYHLTGLRAFFEDQVSRQP